MSILLFLKKLYYSAIFNSEWLSGVVCDLTGYVVVKEKDITSGKAVRFYWNTYEEYKEKEKHD